MEACKGKVFQATQSLPFAAVMLPWLQRSPVTGEQRQLDTHNFPRDPNDPSCRKLTVTVLPAALALTLETGLSRSEELFKHYAIKK